MSGEINDFMFDFEMKQQMLMANAQEVNEFLETIVGRVGITQELANKIRAADSPELGDMFNWINQVMQLARQFDIVASAVREAKRV